MVFVRFRLNVADFHLCYWIKLNKINDWLKYSKFLSRFYFLYDFPLFGRRTSSLFNMKLF